MVVSGMNSWSSLACNEFTPKYCRVSPAVNGYPWIRIVCSQALLGGKPKLSPTARGAPGPAQPVPLQRCASCS